LYLIFIWRAKRAKIFDIFDKMCYFEALFCYSYYLNYYSSGAQNFRIAK
jgi:hypothetical protein